MVFEPVRNFSKAPAYHQVEPVTPQRERYVSYNAITGLETVSNSNPLS